MGDASPRTWRPAPGDERASDLFHWQTTLLVRAADVFAQNLMAENFRFVSPGVVAIGDGRLGFSRGLLARDPDGHVIALSRKMNRPPKAQSFIKVFFFEAPLRICENLNHAKAPSRKVMPRQVRFFEPFVHFCG